MIIKYSKIINNKEITLFFDTEQQAYLVSRDAMEVFLESIQKLKTIEDAEEKGLSFKVPVAIGDYVYQIDRAHNKINTKQIASVSSIVGKQSQSIQFNFETTGHCFHIDFGRTVFTNKVDAMNALNAKTEVKK